MKKSYNQPITEIAYSEPYQVICASIPSASVDKGSSWGADSQYAPAEWVNERQSAVDVGRGFSVVSAGNDENDWVSRSNSSLFD